MITSFQHPRSSATPPGRRGETRGFALLITIVLMALLVLIMVSFSALTRVEIQIAANYQAADAARQNALVGLQVALGKLQAAAGPDQRVTARGDILSTTHTSKANWTGVWDTTAASPTPNWLVSTADPAVAATATGAAPTLAAGVNADASNVRLVGSGSADTSVAGNGNEIVVPLQALKAAGVPGQATTPQTVGKIGYWVGDEGIKARINLDDPRAERSATTTGSPSASAFSPTDDQKRLSLMVPGRTGGELLSTTVASSTTYLDSTGFPATGTTAAAANFRRDLAKVLSPTQLSLLGTPRLTITTRKNRFYDLSVSSRGVLADVAQGGLKKDLTAGLLGSSTPVGMGDTDEIFSLPSLTSMTTASGSLTTASTRTLGINASGNIPAKFPTWGALRSYVNLQTTLSGPTPTVTPRATTNTQMGLVPVINRYQMFMHVACNPNASAGSAKTFQIIYLPLVVLWNPYNVKLAAQRYGARIFVQDTDFFSNGGKKLTPTIEATDDSSPTKVVLRGYGTITLSGWSFTIDCPVLEPGESVVFTPSQNLDYNTSLPTTRLLSAGNRARFWYEAANVGDTIGSPGAPTTMASGKTLTKLTIRVPSIGNAAMEMRLGDTFTAGRNGLPTGQLAQTVERVNWFALGYNIFNTVNNPAATPAGLFAGTPCVGWAAISQFASSSDSTKNSGSDNKRGIRWLANYNPAAPQRSRTALESQSGGNGTYNTNPSFCYGNASANTATDYTIDTPDVASPFAHTYVGNTFSQNGGVERAVLFDLPRSGTGVISLGALQHLNPHPYDSTLKTADGIATHGYAAGAMPAYIIGNSFADPRVSPTDSDGFPDDWGSSLTTALTDRKFHLDMSYVLNRVLWDRYYFSSVPVNGAVTFPLANSRLGLYDPANLAGFDSATLTSELRHYDKAAQRLLVEGAFNVNSTSVEAWRAVLGSLRNAPVVKNSGALATVKNQQNSPYPRTVYTEGDQLDVSSETLGNLSAHNGFRALSDAQIDELAVQVVAQVKSRGPFTSMAKFVNRTPSSATVTEQLSGALQAAIDATSVNIKLATPRVNFTDVKTNNADDPRLSKLAADGPGGAAAPGYLIQGDLLQALAPVLTVRSDTFTIRAYGETTNPVTAQKTGQAWCEAVVQRTPEFINNADAPEAWPASAAENTAFGRRFKIVSFRWLSPQDL